MDEDTGLYDYRARWYDPATGRFASEDPAGFDADDMNLYRYVGNNPMIYTDPSRALGLLGSGRALGVRGGRALGEGSLEGSWGQSARSH